MEVISLTDLIIQKIFRMKSILNDGKTSVSEGIDANFQDILNYSVFAQILLKNKLNEEKIIIGNWKNYLNYEESIHLSKKISNQYFR